jgi:hypothetical protein
MISDYAGAFECLGAKLQSRFRSKVGHYDFAEDEFTTNWLRN